MRLAVILIACLLPVAAVAGDVVAGKSLYTTCQTCHGAKAEGNVGMNAPALTWQDPSYLKRQLQNFKAGIRGSDPRDNGGSQMRAMTATLANEAAIDNVVAYIESLPNTKTVATLKGNTANGRDYYSMVCGGCHGPKAEGNAALNAPALAGIDDWYLLHQFEQFRSGARGSHADDKYGAQMKAMTRALPNEQAVRDVVTYIHTLAP
jgi:cbb3-type cytochrome c oxidase subunit III